MLCWSSVTGAGNSEGGAHQTDAHKVLKRVICVHVTLEQLELASLQKCFFFCQLGLIGNAVIVIPKVGSVLHPYHSNN